MKQILFKVMGGAVFCLSLVFSSCGNIDNPLEEIGKNSTAVALSGALEEGAEVSFNFKYVAGEIETPIQVKFKKEGDKFAFIDADYQIPENIDEDLAENIDNWLEDLLSEEKVEKVVKLEYDKANNQLKASFVFSPDDYDNDNEPIQDIDPSGTRSGGDDITELSLLTVVFEISNNKYTQYVYPFEGFFIWAGVSVNGSDKTNLLKTDYSEKADFYFLESGSDARAFSRTRNPGLDFIKFFRVYYNDGETWADVDKRYKEQGGYPLLIAYSELDDEIKTEVNALFEGDFDKENFAYIIVGNEPVPFIYFDNELNDNPELVYVKPNEKLGYEADGETPNPKGYIFADSYLD